MCSTIKLLLLRLIPISALSLSLAAIIKSLLNLFYGIFHTVFHATVPLRTANCAFSLTKLKITLKLLVSVFSRLFTPSF